MKHTFKTLLGLVLVVFVLAGCSNPAGPEIPEVNEPPVVEIPEENVKLTKVEFKWGEEPDTTRLNKDYFSRSYARYLLDLRSKSLDDCSYDCDYADGCGYVYDYPEGYDRVSYKELRNDPERFKKFSDDAFEKVFGTKYYKEGTVIDLGQWTAKAIDLVESAEDSGDIVITTTNLYFLAEDVGKNYDNIEVKSFDKIEVKNEDIVVYVYWDMRFWTNY